MKNITESIMEVAMKVIEGSGLPFLKTDYETVVKDYNGVNAKEIVGKLEKIFVNAGYAGDYKSGEFSFVLRAYLENYDITEQLNNF